MSWFMKTVYFLYCNQMSHILDKKDLYAVHSVLLDLVIAISSIYDRFVTAKPSSKCPDFTTLVDFVGEFVGSLPALMAVQSHTFHTSPQGPSSGLECRHNCLQYG